MVAKKRPRVMYFPTLDYLTPYQQKKKLKELASEVEVYNMYDDINNVPQLDEIYKMQPASAKTLLETVRAKHKQRELRKHWDTSTYQLYNKLYPWAGVQVNEHGSTTVEYEQKKSDKNPHTVTINIHGVCSGGEVQNRLMSLAEMIETGKEFEINVTVKEI